MQSRRAGTRNDEAEPRFPPGRRRCRTAYGASASAVRNARHAVIASVGAPSGAVPSAHDHPLVMQRKE
jgi:hypothetical protein